jgi:ankyrin repeat protein
MATLAISIGVLSSPPAEADAGSDKSLVEAALKGDASSVSSLVSSGANPNASIAPSQFPGGSDGPFSPDLPVTPLRAAVYCGCAPIVASLMISGADPRAYKGIALIEAIEMNELDVAELLLAKLGHAQPSDSPFVAMLIHRGSTQLTADLKLMVRHLLLGDPLPPAWSSTPDSYDWNLLMAPVFTTSASDPALLLLDHFVAAGYPIDGLATPDPDEASPRKSADLQGDLFLSRALAARGASLPTGWSQKDEDQTLLTSASAGGNDIAVRPLISAGADPKVPDPSGAFALPSAVAQQREGIIPILLSAGGSPDASGAGQHSALAQAVVVANISIVKALIAAGADPNHIDSTGEWPLRYAVRHGQTGFVSLFVASHGNLSQRDTRGRSILHDVVISDQSIADGDREVVSLPPSFYSSIPTFAQAHFDFSAKDNDGRSILESDIAPPPDQTLLRALLDNGAPVTRVALSQEIATRSTDALTLLLAKAPTSILDDQLLNEALTPADDQAAPLLAALVDAGAPLPQDPTERYALLDAAAHLPNDDGLGTLLNAGISASVDGSNHLLFSALEKGNPTRIKLLLDHGAPSKGASYYGEPLLTYVVRRDAARPSGQPTRLGQDQQQAIAALVDGGYDPSITDTDGKTATDIAKGNADTLQALMAGLGAAGASTEPMHKAVRDNDLPTLAQLVAIPGSDINNLDSQGRTPLSYALQLQHLSAARMLLHDGAQITYTPRVPYQQADLDFATNKDVASAFAIRILQDPLLFIPPKTNTASITAFEQAYVANNQLRLGDFQWSVGADCGQVKCVGRWIGAGNSDFGFMPVRSLRSDRDRTSSYKLIQYAVRSVTSGWAWKYPDGHVVQTGIHFEVTFNVKGDLRIPSCQWDIQAPVCAPGVRIDNPNVASTLQLQTDEGFESPPAASMTVRQAGGRMESIAPGQSKIYDRSKGDLTISLDPVDAKVFSLQVSATVLAGADPIDRADDPRIENRMAAYIQMAKLRALTRPPTGQGEDDVINKTVASETMALTEKCLDADYRRNVLTALRTQAQAIVNLDNRVTDLRNLVIAAAALTPDEIRSALQQINALLANPSTGNRSTLLAVQSALNDALPAAINVGTAVAHLSVDTFDDVDRILEDYQALVLEYAQYVPVQSLDGTLDAASLAAIKARLDPHDVSVPDKALSGHGKAIRSAFGLPDPRS